MLSQFWGEKIMFNLKFCTPIKRKWNTSIFRNAHIQKFTSGILPLIRKLLKDGNQRMGGGRQKRGTLALSCLQEAHSGDQDDTLWQLIINWRKLGFVKPAWPSHQDLGWGAPQTEGSPYVRPQRQRETSTTLLKKEVNSVLQQNFLSRRSHIYTQWQVTMHLSGDFCQCGITGTPTSLPPHTGHTVLHFCDSVTSWRYRHGSVWHVTFSVSTQHGDLSSCGVCQQPLSFHCRLVFYSMNTPPSHHPLAERCLHRFQLVAVVNKATISIRMCTQVFPWTVFIHLGCSCLALQQVSVVITCWDFFSFFFFLMVLGFELRASLRQMFYVFEPLHQPCFVLGIFFN
jgi:hypothetical protein